MIHVLKYRKGRVVLFPGRVYTVPLVVVVLFPSEGLHHELEKEVLFLCSEAVKSLDS